MRKTAVPAEVAASLGHAISLLRFVPDVDSTHSVSRKAVAHYLRGLERNRMARRRPRAQSVPCPAVVHDSIDAGGARCRFERRSVPAGQTRMRRVPPSSSISDRGRLRHVADEHDDRAALEIAKTSAQARCADEIIEGEDMGARRHHPAASVSTLDEATQRRRVRQPVPRKAR